MKFENKNHQAIFNNAANKLNRHDKTKMAILYGRVSSLPSPRKNYPR